MRPLSILKLGFVFCLMTTPAGWGLAAPAPTGFPSYQGPDVKPVPPGVKLTVAFDQPEYLLGENALLQFTLENEGKEPFEANFGGDYRGIDRSLRFHVSAIDAGGNTCPEPDPNPACFGGISHWQKLDPGKKITISLPLMRYCQINEPGRYTIRVTHDFGWKEDTRKIPVAETTVTFRSPDAREAEQVVSLMEKLSNETSISFGEKSPDFADFRCLRYAVYLNPLSTRARAGDLRALEGVAHIATPEATEVLIELANSPDAALSLAAARHLNGRLPDPEFLGKLPARGPFNIYNSGIRKKLSAASWDAKFAGPIRALGRKFLARPEPDAINCGAFMIEAVGTAEDAPAVFQALNRAMEMPVVFTPRRDPKDNVLDLPAPLPELLRASDLLHAGGIDSRARLSGDGEVLAYFSAWKKTTTDRPEEWLHLIDVHGKDAPYPVRQVALQSIPTPLPESCLKFVRRGLSDKDPGVCMTACTMAGASGRKEFLKPLLEILATENEPWTLRAASNSALELGGGYELLLTWSDRLGDEQLFSLALDGLQTVLVGLPGGHSGRTDLTRTERLGLRDAWKKFLAVHEKELRDGKKYNYSDPVVTPELFGRARSWRLADGSEWPIVP